MAKVEGLDTILSKLSRITERDPVLMNKIGFKVVQIIEDRTGKGVDVNGKQFKPYSVQYSLQRKKKGRQQGVNLEVTGRMLSNMTHKVEGSKVTVLFPDRLQDLKARVISIGEGKQPKREFFALSSSERAVIENMIIDNIKSKL